MRYADEHKPNSEPLDRFVKRKGGVNKCAARFSRSLRAISPINHASMRLIGRRLTTS
jgi:hypothetical protein